jgi:hypothetical protein
LAQQLEVSDVVRFVGQNYLPGITALRNVMGNIDHNDARQSSHCEKISETIHLRLNGSSFEAFLAL